MESNLTVLAERVREACIHGALRAHEDAGIQGLCSSGRWEAAVAAIRQLDLHPLIAECAIVEVGLGESQQRILEHLKPDKA